MARLEASMITDLIGKPFAWAGRGPDRFDCWGIVLHVGRLYGFNGLPDYDDVTSMNAAVRTMASERSRLPWEDQGCIDQAEEGSIVLLASRPGAFHHAGIVTPWGVLHCTEKLGVVITRQSDLASMGYRHTQVYRWVG